MQARAFHIAAVVILSAPSAALPQASGTSCRIVDQKVFAADGEKVRLARSTGFPAAANFAVYRAPLAVNTDGAPNSYHPMDPLGASLAINRYDNGISVRRAIAGAPLSSSQRLKAFGTWRDGGFVDPPGFKVTWKNVIASNPAGKPCVFATGTHAGYFGSLTAVKNGLSGAAAGECQAANQLDQRYVPATVLRGGAANPLTGFGAKARDLVVAINPATGVVVPAIIGDVGNGKRIGEGSVALNMALLGVTEQPQTYAAAASKLDTGINAMIVAVLPGSRNFKLERPYTRANIEQRVAAWAAANGYGDTSGLAKAISGCASGL
jgi:hypothetical protein